MTEERLQEIEQRAQAATEGEWKAWKGEIIAIFPKNEYRLHLTENDAEFISSSRQDIPDLMEEVRRLQAIINTMASWLVGSDVIAHRACTNHMKNLDRIPTGCDGNCEHADGIPNTVEDVISFVSKIIGLEDKDGATNK